MGLKRYFFNRETKRMFRHSAFVNWGKASSVLILFESDKAEKNEYIHRIIKEISEDGKRVAACGYVNEKHAKSVSTDSFLMLDKQSVSVLGKPRREIVSNMLERNYDLVIDLTSQKSLPLKYMLVRAKAVMRCGAEIEGADKLYDFMIKMDGFDGKELKVESVLELYNQTRHYLSMIKG